MAERVKEVELDPEFMGLAERISDVLETYRGRVIKPDDVDLRMIAEFCWALDVTPNFSLRPRTAPAHKEKAE